MKLLEKLITKPKIFQRILGLQYEQFVLLIKRVKPLWVKAEITRKAHESRKRKIGAGHPCHLKTLNEMITIVLLYYKSYATQEFIGLIVDLDQSNVSRLLKKMLPLIEQAADPILATYLATAKNELEKISAHQRVNNWDMFLKQYPDLKEACTDATEQQCYRSTDYETQKKYYSGKKKKHSLKTQITVAESGRVLDVSKTVPGSVHD